MANGTPPQRVLVVDDEPQLVELYEMVLGGEYEVHPALGGPEALAKIESVGEFDVALVDRRMPTVSGDQVLARLNECSPSCRVAMVTAVEPDFDVLDMPFDEYIVKPVTPETIQETVERLLRMKRYREQCREEYAIASKVATLRAHKEPTELADNDEYQALTDRLAALRESLEETTDEFTPSDFTAAFADIGGSAPRASRSS